MKNRLPRFGTILLLVGLVVSSNAGAQEVPSPFIDKKVVGFEPTDEAKIAMARKMIGAKRYQEAADLLEVLYEADPDNGLVVNLLRSCFDQLQQYDKAEMLIRRLLEKEPQAMGHRLYLAELLTKLDRKPEALEVYNEVAQTYREGDPGRTLVLVRSLMRSGLNDEALTLIDEVRQASADPASLAIERGSILEKQLEYYQAALEYLPLLAPDTTSEAGRAEKRLLAMLAFEGSAEVVENLLRADADSTSSVRTMRLLSDHYLQSGRFAEAFSYVLKQDSLEGRTGFPLVSYMRRCQERQCWSQVIEMAEVILQQYPTGGFEIEVSFEYARALAQSNRADEAADVYSRLVEQGAQQQTKADALYGLGVLYYDYLKDNDRAIVYFDSVVNHYPRGRAYLMARKAAPLCHLREGRLEEARRRFRQLSQLDLPGELQEEVTYFLGLVDFFDRRYDSAGASFSKLMVDHPKGFYVNDALQLVLAMGEAKDAEEALNAYASALYLKYRGMDDSVRVRLYAIADGSPPILGDLALYQLISLELNRGDSAAALAVIDRLSEAHAESYYQPLGLKIKADLLAGSSDGWGEARELYRLLLESYPDYPFVREIREKLRRLDEDQPVG